MVGIDIRIVIIGLPQVSEQLGANIFFYFLLGVVLQKSVGMVNCPNCGKKREEPAKKIENSLFTIEVYTCGQCGLRFKHFT
jgi:hypothetical protein